MGIRSRVFAIIMLVVGAGIAAVPRISGQMCNGNLFAIQQNCEKYYKPSGPMMAPSEACCRTLRGVDVPCMCKLAANYQSQFSSEKIVYVLRYCGVPVAAGTRCGNYTVPPAPPPPPM